MLKYKDLIYKISKNEDFLEFLIENKLITKRRRYNECNYFMECIYIKMEF